MLCEQCDVFCGCYVNSVMFFCGCYVNSVIWSDAYVNSVILLMLCEQCDLCEIVLCEPKKVQNGQKRWCYVNSVILLKCYVNSVICVHIIWTCGPCCENVVITSVMLGMLCAIVWTCCDSEQSWSCWCYDQSDHWMLW